MKLEKPKINLSKNTLSELCSELQTTEKYLIDTLREIKECNFITNNIMTMLGLEYNNQCGYKISITENFETEGFKNLNCCKNSKPKIILYNDEFPFAEITNIISNFKKIVPHEIIGVKVYSQLNSPHYQHGKCLSLIFYIAEPNLLDYINKNIELIKK